MSEIEIDDSSKGVELNNGNQVNIKIEPHKETIDNGDMEELVDDKVIYIKEEVANDEVAEAHSVVNVTIDIKREYSDTTENVCDEEIVTDEGVCKIKLEVDASWTSFEDTKGDDGRIEALPHHKELRVVLEDVMLTPSKYNTQDSIVQLTAELSKDNQTVIQSIHPAIKNKNILVVPEGISNMVSVSNGAKEIKEALLVCDICNKQFNIKKSLRRHIRKHSEMYSCTFCSFKTRYRNYVNDHINGVHTKRTIFKCDYCSYSTHFKNLLTLHINKKHAASDSYNCTKCGNVTYRGDKLSDDTDAKHTNVNAFNCSHCNFKTFRQNRRHTDVPKAKDSVYNCTSCNYKSGDKWNCIRHVNAKHSKTEVYNCPLCSYKAYHKMTLAKHVNVKHTKANVYKCSRCSYKAYNEYNLKVHVNVKHTKTTVYDCSHCSYKAYNKCTLSKHVSAKHTRTVFVCSYCTFESNYQTSLTRHLNSMHPEFKK